MSYLVGRGFESIALLGHSLGGVKVLYSQAHQAHTAVKQIIAISPPSLSHDRFISGPSAESFHSSMAEAERLNQQGQPEMLFQATFPFPLILSAGTYRDKYGPESRYDFLRFTDKIDQPVLFTFGELELQHGGVAFENLTADIEKGTWTHSPQVLTVPGANHFYADCFQSLSLLLTRNLS